MKILWSDKHDELDEKLAKELEEKWKWLEEQRLADLEAKKLKELKKKEKLAEKERLKKK